MTSFTIPSIFTAVDRVSSVMRTMTGSVQSFTDKAEAGVARSERMFRKLTPALGEASKQMLSMVGTGAAVAAIFAGGAFSVKSVMDYEDELANLQAVTGASGKTFDVFKSKIKDVATATKASSVQVAQAFTAIANNQPELLKDANALAMVTQSSILLAQASKMELQPAGEALTQILNQFGKGAADAAKTVDILAAGSVAGSSEIRDTAEAIKQFGTVAANAGIKINESVALIELASKFEKGSEAGSKLRNILITMSAIKVQDPKALKDLHRLGVNMNVVSNSALPLNTRLLEMSKISKDNAALFHVFGKENQAMAAGILSTSDNYTTMIDAVNTAGMATSMAAKNNDTFRKKIEQLQNKFVTWITTSDQAAEALSILKRGFVFLANHMTTIIKVIGYVIGAFVLWKAWIIASKIALVGMRAVSAGFFLVDMIKYIASTQGITFAQAAWAIVTQTCTTAMAALSAAMLANPIGLIIIAIVALIALVTVIIKKWNDWGAALAILLGPLGMIISLIQSFRRNWDMITKAFSEGGIIAGLKAIGATLLDAILMPLEQVFKLLAKLPSFLGGGLAADAMQGIHSFRDKIGVNTTTDESGDALPTVPAINTKGAQQDALVQKMQTTNSAKVSIDINDPNKRASAKSDDDFVKINTTSTMPVH